MFSRTGGASSITTLGRVAAEILRCRLTGHARRVDIKREVAPVVMSGSIVSVLFAAVADGEPVLRLEIREYQR
jgi:archaeosine-15-forming tRNA-guanine transglycosylase